MRIKKGMLVALILAVAVGLATSGCEQKPRGSLPVAGGNKIDYSNIAKISITDALSRAQEKYAGMPVEAELKSKDGYLVYEVKIVGADKEMMDVLVDAGNGAILNAKKEKE